MISSFAKCVSILDYFEEGRVSARLDDLAESLGTSRATTYRYVATLCDAGLLASTASGMYVMGPRIIEMDRLIRISDPLLLAGSSVMREVSKKLNKNMMLARFYRNRIMCVDIAWPDESIIPTFERGKPMSLFRGAMAKVILSNLSPYQLKNMALNHADEVKAAGLGSNWAEFRTRMAELSKQGYAITKSEMATDMGGISAPIFDAEGKIMGSITFVISARKWTDTDFDKLRRQLLSAAEQITKRIAQEPLCTTAVTDPNPAKDKLAVKKPLRKRAIKSEP